METNIKKDRIVYLHIKLDTGEPFYVGKGNLRRSKCKYNRNKHWYNIVNKHSYDIIILEDNLTNEESLEKEIYWIDRIGRKDLGKGPLVNFTSGGEGTVGRKFKHLEETKKKISVRLQGREFSEEWKKKISKSHKGKKYSSEMIRKFSEGHIGKPKSHKGKPWTEARRQAQINRKGNDTK